MGALLDEMDVFHDNKYEFFFIRRLLPFGGLYLCT